MFADAIAAAAATCRTRCAPTRGWCSPRIRSRCGRRPRCGPDLYSRQVAYAARLVAAAAGYADYDQVWQSRSGPPQVPWLEPDVADHLTTLAERAPRPSSSVRSGSSPTTSRWCGISTTSCASRPRHAGIAFARAATPNADRRFARLAVDLIDELRDGREPARVVGAGCRCRAARLQRSTASLCTPDCGPSLARPGRLQDRADRGHPRRAHHRWRAAAAHRWRSAPPTTLCSPIGISPALTVMIASTCAAFSSTRKRARRRVVGNPVLPGGFQHLLDEPARIVDVRRRAARPAARRARRRPTAPPSAARTRPRRGRGVRRPALPGSEYTVHDSAGQLGRPRIRHRRRRRRTRSRGPGRPLVAGGSPVTMIASPAVRASRWNWVPAASPRTSPGTGSTTAIAGAAAGDGPAAVRSVCSSDTAPAVGRHPATAGRC